MATHYYAGSGAGKKLARQLETSEWPSRAPADTHVFRSGGDQTTKTGALWMEEEGGRVVLSSAGWEDLNSTRPRTAGPETPRDGLLTRSARSYLHAGIAANP